jgi:hypothetical protein
MLAAVGLAALSAVVAGGPIAVRPATFGLPAAARIVEAMDK